MPDAAAIIERIDHIMVELAEIRAELAATIPAANGADAGLDDFTDFNLIDPASAELRFGIAADGLRKAARATEGTADAIGIRHGRSWRLSIPRLRQRYGRG